MNDLIHQMERADSTTQKLIKHYVETQPDKVQKINGKISRDLERIDTYAFLQASAYETLREKYKRARKGKQWLELLDMMKAENCKEEKSW